MPWISATFYSGQRARCWAIRTTARAGPAGSTRSPATNTSYVNRAHCQRHRNARRRDLRRHNLPQRRRSVRLITLQLSGVLRPHAAGSGPISLGASAPSSTEPLRVSALRVTIPNAIPRTVTRNTQPSACAPPGVIISAPTCLTRGGRGLRPFSPTRGFHPKRQTKFRRRGTLLRFGSLRSPLSPLNPTAHAAPGSARRFLASLSNGAAQ